MRRILTAVSTVFVGLCVMSPSLDAQKSVSYRQVVEQASTTTIVSSSINPSPSTSPVVFTAHVKRSACRCTNRHGSVQRESGI